MNRTDKIIIEWLHSVIVGAFVIDTFTKTDYASTIILYIMAIYCLWLFWRLFTLIWIMSRLNSNSNRLFRTIDLDSVVDGEISPAGNNHKKNIIL